MQNTMTFVQRKLKILSKQEKGVGGPKIRIQNIDNSIDSDEI